MARTRKDVTAIFRTTEDSRVRDEENAKRLGCSLSEYYRMVTNNVRWEPVVVMQVPAQSESIEMALA